MLIIDFFSGYPERDGLLVHPYAQAPVIGMQGNDHMLWSVSSSNTSSTTSTSSALIRQVPLPMVSIASVPSVVGLPLGVAIPGPVSMVPLPSPQSPGVTPSKKPRLSTFSGVEARPELRQPLHVDVWDNSNDKRPVSDLIISRQVSTFLISTSYFCRHVECAELRFFAVSCPHWIFFSKH